MTVTVERSNSSGDLMHLLVGRGWQELQATLEAAGISLPRHVEREMERRQATATHRDFALYAVGARNIKISAHLM